jgi:L-methionine (R)-S-oxide reductase
MADTPVYTQDYDEILAQIKHVTAGEKDLIANLANITAILKDCFNHHWVGFYLVKEDELVLGPFQGPLACTRIKFGKGVCGKAWENRQTMLVNNVHEFPGHIACSALSNSEIVVPVLVQGKVEMVLDIDSLHLHHFSNQDKIGLEKIAHFISSLC